MGDNTTATGGLAEQIAHKTSAFIQSDPHRDLLDIVDTLRSEGVSHYVDLPQIIVCGSQSSGKSSTLESLSGIDFPTSEGLCTRFATELVLRRGDEPGIRVHIQPGANRNEADRERLSAFSLETSEERNFGDIIEAAKSVMGLADIGSGSKIFSTDVLRVESTSPTAPNLTLVDLPGLFGAADKNQSDDDATMVQNLVVSYMKQRRSIILAVITADNPFANQPVTKFAREIDPPGSRTLGLITKPDKIDRGSESERYYVDLAQNQNVQLKLGWHVLRNRGHNTADDSISERDEREAEFFEESIWGGSLHPSQLGVEALREKLRSVLWKQIKDGLPGVKSDVQGGISDCEKKLEMLGQARTTKREKHTYLQRISSRLSTLVRAAIDGVYADNFFETHPTSTDALQRRLRAKVQLILSDYAEKMRSDGHYLEVVEDDLKPIRSSRNSYIMRSAYLEVVKTQMIECRGRELPGTYNPLVVGDLFSRQCKPWAMITKNLIEEVHAAASETFDKMITNICDQNTRTRLMALHVQPTLYKLRKDLQENIDEFLRPHLSIHPITYNDYLTATVTKIQTERHNRKFDRLSVAACGWSYSSLDSDEDAEEDGDGYVVQLRLRKLLRILRSGTAPDVEEYSASLAADVAQAYYQVALKKFIDDVSVNAIETCLIQCLPDVFSPDVVWDMSEDHIEVLGSENESTVRERAELKQKLSTLEKGLRDLDAFTGRTGTTLQ